ncbi:ankyrin repeat domain-containing protein [Candidatus Babela massiliensis]|uniref:Ankyrin repeats containing protein n=1 Tax=Candidatus Babela massiliensis TaxID=673862 RepID=V6DJK0_9BACT|nr:ankyrin repeat domain-containing protein [Candidatus Babela massiliensis]CDK31063.1 Ankyrin repeats containing protein [Candidatus Babela massiliensis]
MTKSIRYTVTFLLSGIFLNNINSMECQKRYLDVQINFDIEQVEIFNILSLPQELILLIVEQILKDSIANWDDIFNFNREELVQEIRNISLTCLKFNDLVNDEYLKNKVIKLKEKRFSYLKDRIVFTDYSNLSKYNLNVCLKEILDIINPSKADLEEAIKIILMGANVNLVGYWGSTSLVIASEKGYFNIVELLIYLGADINARNSFSNKPALLYASENGYKSIMYSLIKKGAILEHNDIVKFGYEVFPYDVFESDHNDITQILIYSCIDKNTKDLLDKISKDRSSYFYKEFVFNSSITIIASLFLIYIYVWDIQL